LGTDGRVQIFLEFFKNSKTANLKRVKIEYLFRLSQRDMRVRIEGINAIVYFLKKTGS